MSLKHNPRRSLRQQGIDLGSSVGLQTHRRVKSAVGPSNAVVDQDDVNETINEQDHGNVAHVLGSDLAEEEEEVEQHAATEIDGERDVDAATEVNVQHPIEETQTKEAEPKKR